VQKQVAQWRVNNQTIASVNALLQKYNQPPLPVAAAIPQGPECGK
jgi:hypothetical protein